MQIKHAIPALHCAAADGLLHSIEHFGAQRNLLDYKAPEMKGATALHVAAQCGQTAVVRALVDLGASLDLPSDDGSTALYLACLYCRGEAIKALLELGSNPCQASGNGTTPGDVVCPECEKWITQWQEFSSSQKRAVRMHG